MTGVQTCALPISEARERERKVLGRRRGLAEREREEEERRESGRRGLGLGRDGEGEEF